jgi:hypothetical protein
VTPRRLSAREVVDGYDVLFTPLMRAAHRACFEKARLTREDGWPTLADVLEFAKVFEVSAAEFGAFFGYLSYQQGRRAIWVDLRSGEVSAWAARQCATRQQAIASGFLSAVLAPRRPASQYDS